MVMMGGSGNVCYTNSDGGGSMRGDNNNNGDMSWGNGHEIMVVLMVMVVSRWCLERWGRGV